MLLAEDGGDRYGGQEPNIDRSTTSHVLEATLRDSIERELLPNAALASGIAAALRSSLAQNDTSGSVIVGVVTGQRASDRPVSPAGRPRPQTDNILTRAVAAALQADPEPRCAHSPIVEVEETTDRVMPSDLAQRIALALRAERQSQNFS